MQQPLSKEGPLEFQLYTMIQSDGWVGNVQYTK